MIVIEPDVEPAPYRTTFDGFPASSDGVLGQLRICVQKQQNISACRLCAGIHLVRATTRGFDENDPIVSMTGGICLHNLARRVMAAAIHDDDLGNIVGKQRIEARMNSARLVQHRNDHGDRGRHSY